MYSALWKYLPFLVMCFLTGYLMYGNIQLKAELKEFKEENKQIMQVVFVRVNQNATDVEQNRNISRLNYRSVEDLRRQLAELHRHGTVEIIIKHKEE